ncbi:dUTP diphosphatase [bacterium]|nr:dUTP diphosphatase [bacterium]
MKRCVIQVKKEAGCDDLPLPQYQSYGASGLDLYAAITQPVTIEPGEVKLISTGIRISIPPGFEGQVRPRSGLALKHGIGLLNSPGTIDSDYRGIVGIILFNFSRKPFVIYRGDRVAQLVITKIERVSIRLVKHLDVSERESGGFGSTGLR